MKYQKIINKIGRKKNIDKKSLYHLYIKTYQNDNIRSFDNMVSYLKSKGFITDLKENQYKIVTKDIYHYSETAEESKIYQLLYKEYPKITFIVWNTNVINAFTQHYVMKNYLVVETEKVAVNLFVEILKENLSKKYIIVTQKMLTQNRDIYMNDENVIIVKPLRVKSPLDTESEKRVISIEKMMVDIYTDELYLYYQGKELKTIYENIFDKYDINMKKLRKYASLRTKIDVYDNFIRTLNIPKIYKS